MYYMGIDLVMNCTYQSGTGGRTATLITHARVTMPNQVWYLYKLVNMRNDKMLIIVNI